MINKQFTGETSTTFVSSWLSPWSTPTCLTALKISWNSAEGQTTRSSDVISIAKVSAGRPAHSRNFSEIGLGPNRSELGSGPAPEHGYYTFWSVPTKPGRDWPKNVLGTFHSMLKEPIMKLELASKGPAPPVLHWTISYIINSDITQYLQWCHTL